MARLEFAILQHLEGKVRVVLQRNEKDLLNRLLIRVRENLGNDKGLTLDKVSQAIEDSFHYLIQEFKDETIRLV
jgi:hypothetical protein